LHEAACFIDNNCITKEQAANLLLTVIWNCSFTHELLITTHLHWKIQLQ